MDDRSALELLGLAEGEELTRDRLRRAYLRRLRDHPPERDPEGFRTLREAFEHLVRELAYSAEALRRASPFALPRAQPTRSPFRPLLPATPPLAPSPFRPLLPTTPLIDTESTPTGTAPGLIGTATPTGTAPGPIGTATPTGTATPAAVEPQAPAPAAPAIGTADATILSRQIAESDEPTPELALEALIDELLAMLERGDVGPATELAERWRERAIDDHRMTSSDVARQWALTRDLLAVAVVLPSSILCALASAIAANDLALARPALERYQRRNPDGARDLERHLRKRATTIHRLVGDVLSDLRPWAPDARRGPWHRVPLLFMLAAMAFSTKLATTCDPSTSGPGRQPHELRLSPTAVERLRAWGAPQVARVARSLQHDPHASSDQIAAAVALEAAARAVDCRALDDALARLWDAPGSAPPGQAGSVDDLIREISRGVAARCGHETTPMTTP